MDKLTGVSFVYNRFPTEEEKIKESYIIKDGLVPQVKLMYTKLHDPHSITLAEAADSYKRLVNNIQPKDGESIDKIEFDLTRYYNYQENGEPYLGSEEDNTRRYDERKKAVYYVKDNILEILINGHCIYQNYNGKIWRE